MRSILLLIIALISSVSFYGQANMEELLKPGTKLIYRIDAPGRSYDCIVSINELKPVSINYNVIDSSGAQGRIMHTSKGLKKGSALYMQFDGGDKALDNNSTSFLLSRKIYRKLSGRHNKPVTMRINNQEPVKMRTVADSNHFTIKINGVATTINQPLVRPVILFNKEYVATGTEYFTFYNSPVFPLILSMHTRFNIELLEIKTK